MKPYLNEREASEYCGCSKAHFIAKWKPNLEPRKMRGILYYRAYDIDSYIKGLIEAEDTIYRRAAQYIHRNSKKRARLKEIEYDLMPDIIEDMMKVGAWRCAVTNMSFDFTPVKNGVRRPWFPSLDRIDSDKGYTRDNCRVVCIAANTAMNVWGESVLLEMAKGIYEEC